MRNREWFSGLAILGVALSAPLSSMAATPVYKCLDADQHWLYTDSPCKDGELLDLHEGQADPAAMAKLEGVRDALDRSAAQRIADQQRQRELPLRYAAADNQAVYEPSQYDYGPGWWLPGVVWSHPPRARGLGHPSGHPYPATFRPSRRSPARCPEEQVPYLAPTVGPTGQSGGTIPARPVAH